jgi:hypothetical protein
MMPKSHGSRHNLLHTRRRHQPLTPPGQVLELEQTVLLQG